MIDLNKLIIKDLIIDEDIIFENKSLINGLKDVKEAHYSGTIKLNEDENIELDLLLTGKMILIDSITLNEIEKDFEIKIEETLSQEDDNFKEYFNNLQNTLDISEILWQNIVLEVPIRIRQDEEDITLEGEGWQLNKKDEEEIDPRLAKLQELLDQRKE
ncbi:MAG: DUF177 domain-containing protein [Bacilli bacterium]|nr:DUF177 domain-containing protein [Bacilli bacterium]